MIDVTPNLPEVVAEVRARFERYERNRNVIVESLETAELHWLDTADHGYRVLKRSRASGEDVFDEMARVARPGGAVCLIQLCAYGPEDREEYFEVLRLRNPARQNFYERADLGSLLALVLTTGLGAGTRADGQRAWIESVLSQGAAAVAV